MKIAGSNDLMLHLTSTPNRPQPNGLLERFIPLVTDGARCCRHQSGLPVRFLSSPKPALTTSGSGRHFAGQTAGRDDAGQNKVSRLRLPRKPTASLVPQRTINIFSEHFSQARTKEILCKPLREQSVLLTIGVSAVYHWDRGPSSLLAFEQCTDAYLSM